MAFFHALGGPTILIECGVIANGSLNGFLSGKHYNRCKRIHPLFAVVIEILNFKSFLKRYDDDGNHFANFIENDLLQIQIPQSSVDDILSKSYKLSMIDIFILNWRQSVENMEKLQCFG